MLRELIDTAHLKKEYLVELGNINPIQYSNELNKLIKASKADDVWGDGNFFFPLTIKYDKNDIIEIDGEKYTGIILYNPNPFYKRDKPSGIAYQNLQNFLQVKEILFYQPTSKLLYLYEYSYHFGEWNHETKCEEYFFRYDREIAKSNPPLKKFEHLHVAYEHPHFNQEQMTTLVKVLDFIEMNWNEEEDRFSYA